MKIWKAQRTLLIVGEGAVDGAFLTHAKSLYAPRGCGLSVKIKTAGGKGASHVIDWTIRQMGSADYHEVGALLDTDVNWTATVAKRAKQKKIFVMQSTPCVEALFLRMLGQNANGDSHTLKKRFDPYVNNAPTNPAQYAKHFSDALFQAARTKEPAIELLLTLLNRRS